MATGGGGGGAVFALAVCCTWGGSDGVVCAQSDRKANANSDPRHKIPRLRSGVGDLSFIRYPSRLNLSRVSCQRSHHPPSEALNREFGVSWTKGKVSAGIRTPVRVRENRTILSRLPRTPLAGRQKVPVLTPQRAATRLRSRSGAVSQVRPNRATGSYPR